MKNTYEKLLCHFDLSFGALSCAVVIFGFIVESITPNRYAIFWLCSIFLYSARRCNANSRSTFFCKHSFWHPQLIALSSVNSSSKLLSSCSSLVSVSELSFNSSSQLSTPFKMITITSAIYFRV